MYPCGIISVGIYFSPNKLAASTLSTSMIIRTLSFAITFWNSFRKASEYCVFATVCSYLESQKMKINTPSGIHLLGSVKSYQNPLILNRISPRSLNYTFCYDSVTDDYKVVLVPTFNITFCSRSFNNFEVYSLKSNSWTQFDQDFQVHFSYMDVVVGGSLHLVGLRKAKGKETIRDAIISIDVSTGEIRVVPKPYDRWTCVVPIVGEFEGFLCFIGTIGNDFFMWLMKDYGVKESWIKLFSISQQAIFPLAYSTNGKKIFLTDDRGHFLTYDLTNRTTTVIRDSNASVPEYANNFVENLVQLSDYGRSNGNMSHGQEEVKLQRKGSVGVMINDLSGFSHRLVLES